MPSREPFAVRLLENHLPRHLQVHHERVPVLELNKEDLGTTAEVRHACARHDLLDEVSWGGKGLFKEHLNARYRLPDDAQLQPPPDCLDLWSFRHGFILAVLLFRSTYGILFCVDNSTRSRGDAMSATPSTSSPSRPPARVGPSGFFTALFLASLTLMIGIVFFAENTIFWLKVEVIAATLYIACLILATASWILSGLRDRP